MNVDVRSQAEFDATLLAGNVPVVVGGDIEWKTFGTETALIVVRAGSVVVVARGSSQPRVEAWGSSQPRVEAWGSSQPRVEAWGSSQPRVEARDSSQPRVEARDSSQPRVEAWGSSQPRVEAWDSSQPRVEAWDSSQPRVVARNVVQLSIYGAVSVTASDAVSVLIDGDGSSVTGGHQTRVVKPLSVQAWCDYHDVPVTDDTVVLFKAVNDTFASPRGGQYTPGTTPVADDWEPSAECGGGLHFSPSVSQSRWFNPDATRYVACPVRLSDCRVPTERDDYPDKIKARGCAGPVWECDEDGEPMKKRGA
jgi:hypothetical protein